MITQKRENYKPFEYPQFDVYYMQQVNSRWTHDKIPMQKDIKDWKVELSNTDKKAIEMILKNFAQTETNIGTYWSSLVPKWFPKAEIISMAQEFASMEAMHAKAYSYLNEILGLEDFKAFLEDDEIMERLELLLVPEEETVENIALSIAIFSAIFEGVLLYSSFTTLMSFKRKNLLKGTSQQMVYSIRDESLHSKAGCELFRVLCSETPGLKESLKLKIINSFIEGVNAEFKCIDKIFENGDLSTIKKSDLKMFIRNKANEKFKELGYDGIIFDLATFDMEIFNWFFEEIALKNDDFFVQRVTNYGEPNKDWQDDDLYSMINKEINNEV